ncbi:MAG: hypothetical protein IKH57_14375 [Clostridia bacterium]|nr:hypothetical protein [Clostridia bacterium]
MKKKSILRRTIPWAVFLALAAVLVVFVGIPLYSVKDTTVENPPVISYYEGGKQPVVMENDALYFEMDPTTTQFVLKEKATGREWLSNPADAAKDPVAVATNKNTLQSTLIVTYSSADGVIDYNNYQYSIQNGNYVIEQTEDGAVEVNYSVGKIEKVYLIPTAITKVRYDEFTSKMKASDVKLRVSKAYTAYSPESLAKMDEGKRAGVLALYPEAENQAIYTLIESTSADSKKKLEELFAGAGYTQEDYDLDMQLVAGFTEKNDPLFNVTVRYQLDGGDFVVQVPYDRIRYRSDYPMTYVTVLPMFGAAGVENQGAMFIPEGGGALINFNNGKLSQNSYYANMYGWDWGSERKEVVSETKNTFPVFGMIKNGASFICIMEGAPSYGGVQADISLRYNSYNWICAKYNVLHSDKYNVSAKTARLVYMFEKQLPDATVSQRYRFIDSGNYVDLAVAYGDYLREKYPELQEKNADSDLPVSVELVGAIDKTVVKFGMPVDSVVPTTTFSQAQEIIRDLSDAQIKNLSVRMSGWMNGGVNQKVLTSLKVQRELGGEKGVKSLIAAAKRGNVPLYFDGISCFAYKSGILQGFIPFRDAARFTTREQIKIYPYSAITFQQQDWIKPFYLVQPSFAQKCADKLISSLSGLEAYGVAFRDIGYILSGDYNPLETVTREQVLQMQIDTVKKAKDAGERVMIKEGYDYVLPYVDVVTDMDLNGIEYSIIDAQIPFYQIAIHGAVSYTGKPINLASDWQTELLRCAEYGAGLNFTFMAEDAKILQDSLHSANYGATYASWKEDAAKIINDYQAAMAGLNGQRMTGHTILADGVTCTDYENGVRVFVNYGDEDYQAEETAVPARSYIVTGGEKQ